MYLRVAEELVKKVTSGEYGPGDRLPSEHDLMEEYRVSRTTAIAALDELVGAHLAYRVQGKGTFVSRPFLSEFSLSAGFSEYARQRGLVPSSRTLALHATAPDEETASGCRSRSVRHAIASSVYATPTTIPWHTRWLIFRRSSTRAWTSTTSTMRPSMT